MNRLLLLFALFAIVPAQAQVTPFVWNEVNTMNDTAAGTAGGVTATITDIFNPEIETDDVTGPAFSYAPLSAAQSLLVYDERSAPEITFDQPVDNVLLYVSAWRPETFEFSLPFTILSGMEGSTTDGNFITTPAGFSDGVIRFRGPTTFLGIDTESLNGSAIAFTLAIQTIQPPSLKVSGKKTIKTSRRRVTIRGTADVVGGIRRVEAKVPGAKFKPARGAERWRTVVRLTRRRTPVRIRSLSNDGLTSKVSRITIVQGR